LNKNIRDIVKERYGNIAKSVGKTKTNSCCGGSCGCGTHNVFGEANYSLKEMRTLPKEAVEAALGCANPHKLAQLKLGEVVLDLGSGGGIDVLMASKLVGEDGKVFGLDMTDEMLELANRNKLKMDVKNVEFIKGYIEAIPLKDNLVDVVMSNCVINLSSNKEKAFEEAYRVLKENGRLAIADIVRLKDVPEDILREETLWSSCVVGALEINDYKRKLEKAGFKNVQIEVVHTYSKEVIDELMQDSKENQELAILNKYKEEFFDIIDNSFGSAYIRASK